MPVSRCTQCGAPGASFSFDARRWTAADLIVGLATFLLAVALFRPGFGRADGWSGGDFGGPSGVAALAALIAATWQLRSDLAALRSPLT
jgi:hypothetical protein